MEVRLRGSSLNRFQYSHWCHSKVVVVMLGLLLQMFETIRAEHPVGYSMRTMGRANRFVDNAVAYSLGGHRVGATNR